MVLQNLDDSLQFIQNIITNIEMETSTLPLQQLQWHFHKCSFDNISITPSQSVHNLGVYLIFKKHVAQ